MDSKKRTEIAELGEFGLIERLTGEFSNTVASTVSGVGDDAAVIASEGDDKLTLISTDMLLEGIHFDLVYFPLKHLGYKAVVIGINDILAMNGFPAQIMLSLGISAKLSVEQLEEFYQGVNAACVDYQVDLVGGDTSASMTGFVVNITAIGNVSREKIAYRRGAKVNDLICITGDLGAAYMGLHLLEREKRALEGHPDPKPDFSGFEYLLSRQLKPSARRDIIDGLQEAGLVPTSMIDLSDGLASDLLQICKASSAGARIYLDKIPIASETYKMAEQLGADPVVAALNGGDDHELLFTIPLEMQDRIVNIGGVDVIGHITESGTGVFMVTPDGNEIPVTAPAIR